MICVNQNGNAGIIQHFPGRQAQHPAKRQTTCSNLTQLFFHHFFRDARKTAPPAQRLTHALEDTLQLFEVAELDLDAAGALAVGTDLDLRTEEIGKLFL